MTTRLLLVDDSVEFRESLRGLLDVQRGIEVVGEAANGQEAITPAGRLTPDVALMDLQMPVMNGIEATLRIIGAMPHVAVLIPNK
ncbi:MAG: response regulator transcription factor [Dehalococcoidia bacterium]